MRNRLARLTLLVVSALAATGSLMARGQGPTGQERVESFVVARKTDRPKYVAAPGWAWMMRPRELRLGESFGQAGDSGIMTGYAHADAEGGGLRVFFVQAGASGPGVELPDYRLVIYDASGQRHLLSRPGSVLANGLGNREAQVRYSTFILGAEVLPPGKAAYIAAERMISKTE
jgi:hypothetical protein